jgi:23S rRNA pseudouridine2605 synthase
VGQGSDDDLIRLNKLLAHLGVASRRHAEEMIIEGRITVDGVTATEKGQKVRRNAVIAVDGEEVGPPPPPAWLALHKPKGYVCTKEDTHDRPIVMDLIPPELQHVHSIGRLDGDVSGLLLFTNQGQLTHRLAHPSYEVDKVYHAITQRPLSDANARRIAEGVELDDGPTAPAQCRILGPEGSGSLVELVIHEGRKHQVKRMFEAVGAPLDDLRRVGVGPVHLGNLERGRWRYLTDDEVDGLYRGVGLEPPQGERHRDVSE